MPSEASFFNGLGMWVAGMAVVSGFGMTVAASQWWSTSIASVLWVLPLWAVLYCLIERLVLKSFGTSWAWNLVLTIPRLLLSLAIALVIGLPMAQVIYSGSINDELSKTTTARIHEATNQITRTYDAKIAAAQKEIAAAQARETRLQRQVTKQPLPRRLRGRSCELLADPQARPRAVLQARRAPGRRRRSGAGASPSPDRGDDRREPSQDRGLAGRREQPDREPGRHDQGRTATSSPARRRSSASRRPARP